MVGNEPIFPIGLRCVQQALDQAGHDTRLIDFVEQPETFADLRWATENWDVIGFTIRNIDPIDLAFDSFIDHYEKFVSRVRDACTGRPPLFVGGGPGYSLFGNALVSRLGFDVGVVGPGEKAMLDIVAQPERYRGAGQNLRGERYADFLTDRLFHPHELMRAYARCSESIGIETRRKTCYQECVYCPYAYISGDNSGDIKPLEFIADELRSIYDSGNRRIFFTDAIFNSELRFAKEVVRMISELSLPGLTWSAYFTPKPFDDEFAELLARSNVEMVMISPDSLDVGMMRTLGKRFDTRHVTRFIERCRQHNLPIRLSVVFGGPGENRETVCASAEYANANVASDELLINVGYRVLPATALSRQLGIPDDELLNPTFYPLDPELFLWIMEYFESRFLSTKRLLHLMVGSASTKRMIKVPHHEMGESGAVKDLPYLALARRTLNGSAKR
jgi:radical SAM superfamily enzyme YgiQ (UPF0313 family)